MRILRTIIIENDLNVIKLFKQFESENSVLFSVVEIIPDFKNITELINTHKPDALILSKDDLVFNPQIFNEINIIKPKLLYISKNKSDAFEAYKYNAIDFLLKPINSNNLIVSVYKIIKHIEMESVFQKNIIGKIDTINTLKKKFEYVSITSVDKIELLKVEDIVFCKADGKYTEFYTANKQMIVSSRNLGEYEPSLNNNFFRIHHSYIVNIKYIIKIIKNNGLFCELPDGKLLPVAKRRQEEFVKFINE
ncbi:LytTR family transcriptional regulator DNA-binding domain-containing protein [Polaribacter litorisediminis]|uniref:LytR/AlgR family response regulator transcription factor n=1 Tax=Polaribacter litorisediminis TaxID=1908341 RepID=UPI001CBE018E|nr:LytTR family transcriptional regulator DNA-binding domain-containing protein [Polaribacter litorisediminis]UAM99431.1 LytTR family transcriptional regulator DNA-binding domain-containing protein [Polaribacter litorisediminis]